MHYSSAYAASSPTVSSNSPPLPPVRVPRYLRRYTVCAASQQRPTSPLANSFIPDNDDDAATSSCARHSSSNHWDPRSSEPFTVNPGPKVSQCCYTTVSSPPLSVFAPVLSPTAVLSRAQSLVADVSQQPQPIQPLRRRSSTSSIYSQLSTSSSSTDCSFHTAVDDNEYNSDECKTLQPLSSRDSPLQQPLSWVEHPLLTNLDSSDSSNSGFRYSGFGFASRGGQSSADTVVSPPDDSGRFSPGKEKKAEYDEDWPVTYLTTVTRQELEDYEKENKPQERRRRFTWGRKEGRKFLTDRDKDETPEVEGKRKTRKLKKKRPAPTRKEEEIVPQEQPFSRPTIPIYTDGELEEFDPLKDFPTHEEPVEEALPLEPDETQIGIAISSDDILQGEEVHPFDMAIEAILSAQEDEWEDMESAADHHHHHHQAYRIPSSGNDQEETWLEDGGILERIGSRTPQEILQGLDVVHEEEEEDSTYGVKDDDGSKRGNKRGSYPFIENKGKERHGGEGGGEDDDDDVHGDTTGQETIDEQDHHLPYVEMQATATGGDAAVQTKPSTSYYEDGPEPKRPSSPTRRRRKLSKRRKSRPKLSIDSASPPIPSLDQKSTKSKTKRTNTNNTNRGRRRSASSLQKLSSTSLGLSAAARRRRHNTTTTTPKTVISSVFRPFALLLSFDGGGMLRNRPRKRLSRDLRTPNVLLVGRHFSEKHIPRFPSRLDGLRTVDKKVAKYD